VESRLEEPHLETLGNGLKWDQNYMSYQISRTVFELFFDWRLHGRKVKPLILPADQIYAFHDFFFAMLKS
jgi:hypothetical protein